jgi:hypothetical protein
VIIFIIDDSAESYFQERKHSARRVFWRLYPKVISKGEFEMALAQQVRLTATKGSERNHDMTILLGYSALAILMVIAICLAWGGPGTEAADFANMTVFP